MGNKETLPFRIRGHHIIDFCEYVDRAHRAGEIDRAFGLIASSRMDIAAELAERTVQGITAFKNSPGYDNYANDVLGKTSSEIDAYKERMRSVYKNFQL